MFDVVRGSYHNQPQQQKKLWVPPMTVMQHPKHMAYDNKTLEQLKNIKQLMDQLDEIAYTATAETCEIMHLMGCMDVLMYKNSGFFRGL